MAAGPSALTPAYGTSADPSSGSPQGGQGQQMDPRKKKMIDQIMMQRQQAQFGQQAMAPGGGGPGFLDQIDQLRLNPFNTWF